MGNVCDRVSGRQEPEVRSEPLSSTARQENVAGAQKADESVQARQPVDLAPSANKQETDIDQGSSVAGACVAELPRTAQVENNSSADSAKGQDAETEPVDTRSEIAEPVDIMSDVVVAETAKPVDTTPDVVTVGTAPEATSAQGGDVIIASTEEAADASAKVGKKGRRNSKAAKAAKAAEPASAAKAGEAAEETPTTLDSAAAAQWIVVGGPDKGGLRVRESERRRSKELPRLMIGARIQELERSGSHLHFKKTNGQGPESGWISMDFKGKETLRLA